MINDSWGVYPEVTIWAGVGLFSPCSHPWWVLALGQGKTGVIPLEEPVAMSRVFRCLVLSAVPAVLIGLVTARAAEKKVSSVLEFTVKDIDGNDVELAKYKGEVLLIVNTASKCGLTPQYEGLEALYEKYKEKGFKVLAFPANEFGKQEPGTNAEIATFCKSNYNVTFPVFSKIVVKEKGFIRFTST